MDSKAQYDVGGVLLNRPFKVRRLGHFGFYLDRIVDSMRFYKDLLGLRITDINAADRSGLQESPADYAEFSRHRTIFMSYSTDHHALVMFNRPVFELMDAPPPPGITLNQISWQVSSLAEVVNATDWFTATNKDILRVGRDFPGSNFHCYLNDPDRQVNEVFYGMEQVGWAGISKPASIRRRLGEKPSLPHASEFTEIEEDLKKGVDIRTGFRDRERMPFEHEVGGVLLARPFKVHKLGPVNLFVQDLDAAQAWYGETLGLNVTEEVLYMGHRCVFMRCNSEHHSLGLMPVALRARLGLWEGTSLMSLGVQLGSYRQLRDAMAFLKQHGVTVRDFPHELAPGMGHSALCFDPEGHALQLYWCMEQVGWDGKPRPAHLRPRVVAGEWPAVLADNGDSYSGEPLFGPWA